MKKLLKRFLAVALSATMLISFVQLSALSAFGDTIDVGSNPTPDVDIAVSVPADYAGDFDSFREELSAALEALGMDPSTFRITDTAVKIDTTNLDGWYVYDHYYSKDAYNKLNLSADQQKKQPYRLADNTCMAQIGGSPIPCLIQDVFVAKKYANPVGNKLYYFNQHTYSHSKDDKAYMIFAGYGTNALSDYMFYPATSDSRRTVEFDLDCAVVDSHTLLGFGFLLNAAIDKGTTTSGDADINDDKLTSYMLYYTWPSTVGIYKLTGVAANTATFSGTSMGTKTVSLGSGMKFRMKVVLEKDKVTVTQRQYNLSTGALGDEVVLFNELSIPVQAGGGNGFGPIVQYKSHGCSSMTYFEYGDLSMTYAATAFDALKNVQYANTADQKYFINLVGDSNDPNIPDEKKESQKYVDGINRMNENEIFYLSNADDGKVLTESTTDESGNKTHTGLGTDNGYIATSPDDYIQQLAEYIYNNYTNKTEFNQAPVESAIPLANFYITNTTDPDNVSQLMTVHQKHLPDGFSVKANIFDKSKVGSADLGAGDKLVQWTLNVYDPDGNIVKTQTVSDPDDITDFEITNKTAEGRYTFELSVKDNNGKTSETFQTYLTVFLDDEEPEAKAANSTKNMATVTLTDRGPGIADDGITFLEDGRGSGVAAYWLTTDKDATPTADDWEYLKTPVHEYSFEVDISEYAGPGNHLVVWYMDECGNVGTKVAYKPIKIEVQNPDGDPIDEYYIISDEPVVVLPDLEDIDLPDVIPNPDPDEPDEEFSGWKIPNDDGDDDDITIGDVIPVDEDDDDPVIVIRPSYSGEKVQIKYNPNKPAAAPGKATVNGQDSETYEVAKGSDLLSKVESQRHDAELEGYKFVKWTLDPEGKQDITSVTLEDELTEVYAQWEIGSYNFYYDFNGGKAVAGGIKERKAQPVVYQTNITTEVLNKVATRELPAKEGYIFKGWSLTKGSTTAVPANTLMPGKDLTVYAIWELDTNKYIVSFDSNGGSKINDHSYLTGDKNYKAFTTPARAGYDFGGWYEKIVTTVPVVDEEGNPVYEEDGTTQKTEQQVTMGTTEIKGGDPILAKYASQNPLQNRTHSLIAKWTPRDDTKYSVAYYINSGAKDAKGEYIYTRVNSLTKVKQGTTEATVTVADEDILEELTAAGNGLSRDYWYNEELTEAKGELSGQITGNGQLILKLYYDRYFDVNVVVGKGEGTVQPALKQKAFSTPTATWEAAEGYHVSRVMVDDRMRDDLIPCDSYTVHDPIHENHYVYVEFEKDVEDPGPVDPDDPDPKPPTPPEPTPGENHYTISAKVEGCYDGTCTITPYQYVLEGSDATVEWNVPDNYAITDITIDGVSVKKENTSAEFTAITANHDVIVTVVKLPLIGANVTKDQYTLTVNVYGGDGTIEVTPSTVTDAGDTINFKCDNVKSASGKYEVYKVLIDGKELTGKNNLNKWTYAFRNIDANHAVSIYLRETGNTDVPVYPEDEYIKLNTQIVGGPGTISNGGVIKTGSDKDVSWDINKVTDPDAADYTYYEVEKVTVNGKEEAVEEDGTLKLEDITEDTKVVVQVKPVYYTVNVMRYGNGTVSASKTMYKYQSYVDISGTPNDASTGVAKVVVDGTTVYPAEDTVSTLALGDGDNDQIGYTKMDKDALNMSITSLAQDHNIEVYFSEIPAGETDPTPIPDDLELFKVTAAINGAVGTVVVGQAIVSRGEEDTVEWTIPSNYKVSKVTVNGVPYDYEDNKLTIENITADMDVQIYAEKISTPNDTKVPVKPDNHDNSYTVETKIVGISGGDTATATIDGAGTYDEDVESTVIWEVINDENTDVTHVVKYVIVDGIVRTDLVDKNAIKFNDGEDHTVVVVIDEENKIPTDVDKDGDGDPDINKDKDGDGEPDVDIDKDGDGEPDINVTDPDDPDDDPVYNIDEDGDLVIDTYVHVNFVDEKGKPLPYDEAKQIVIKGNDGDAYDTTDKYSDNYYGYSLTEVPANATGTMIAPNDKNTREDVITVVNYVYALKDSSVVVNFVDKAGTVLADQVVKDGKVFDKYTAEAKDIYGYQLTNDQDKVEVTMEEAQRVINFVYELKDAKVIVKYVDEDGTEIAQSVEHNGKVFDEYLDLVAADYKDIYGYDYVTSESTAKRNDGMEEDVITVTYKYKHKDVSITAKYVDKDGNELIDPVVKTGKYGSEYTTEEKTISGYIFDRIIAGEPEGILRETQDNETVVYEYARAGVVIVKYVAPDGSVIKEEETAYKYGDTYETSAIDVDENYELAYIVGDATGTVDKDTIVVIYTYKDKTTTTPTNPTNPTEPTKPTDPVKPTPTNPDINIDIDGDGEPDINIDIDGDGEPDINIDKDGDKVPDINIDKDGDGKPDLNIDIDGDGKPDLNIDTDGDGEPDLNIDTNGDGIADLNIDTDGDGIADTNLINPIDTGSTDMYAMYAYAFVAVAAALVVVLLMRKNRREDEAEA